MPNTDVYAYWLSLILSNFSLSMFILAVVFMLLHFIIRGRKISGYEIIYRWTALFAVGFSGLYAAFMHAVFPDLTAANIGWTSSPFQFEVAMANVGFGLIGVLSFNASYGFRLATVIGNAAWLWGDAIGHLYQQIVHQNYSIGNAGSWFWMDIILPVILIICIIKLRPRRT